MFKDGSKSGGRPKGTENKRSTHVLYKLEHEHDFSVIGKIVQLYNETEQIYKPLFEKVLDLMERKQPIQAVYSREDRNWSEGLRPADFELFNKVRGDLWVILAKLLGYTYPKLKTLEVDTGNSDKVIFNISIPKTGSRGIELKDVELSEDNSEEVIH
jgi:hypothetical protein